MVPSVWGVLGLLLLLCGLADAVDGLADVVDASVDDPCATWYDTTRHGPGFRNVKS